jgi:hypothetical protein
MAQMEVARRVSRNVFDIDFLVLRGALAIIGPFFENRPDDRAERGLGHEEIDKARAGHFSFLSRASEKSRIRFRTKAGCTGHSRLPRRFDDLVILAVLKVGVIAVGDVRDIKNRLQVNKKKFFLA